MSVTDLKSVGITRMDDEDIERFLASQGVGVLGLPTDDGPYLTPMSFGYDGGDSLYFTYVTGSSSRKAALSDQAEIARFLVFKTPSKFSWQSVSLNGTLRRVPEAEWDDLEDVLANAWHPDVFATVTEERCVEIHRFDIVEADGLKQTKLPPSFEPESGTEDTDPAEAS